MSDSERQPAFRPLSRHFWLVLGVGVCVVLAFFATYVVSTDCNGVKQAINMRKARHHIEAIAPKVWSLSAGKQVTMTDYTGGRCGSILVRGICDSRQDADALRAEIVATNPPVEVLFQIGHSSASDAPHFELNPIPAPKVRIHAHHHPTRRQDQILRQARERA